MGSIIEKHYVNDNSSPTDSIFIAVNLTFCAYAMNQVPPICITNISARSQSRTLLTLLAYMGVDTY